MNFKWKVGETFKDDWTWDEVQNCNPKAIGWNWGRLERGELYPLPGRCFKALILGSPKVGKSTLLWSYFDECDGPTVCVTACSENYELHLHNMQEDSVNVKAYFCDVTRTESCLKLGSDVYRDTTVVVYCYDVNDVQSLKDLCTRWIPMSRVYLGKVPSIMVGNMIDVRDGAHRRNVQRGRSISTDEGKFISRIYGINRFFECSIEDGDTPPIIFQTALRLSFRIET